MHDALQALPAPDRPALLLSYDGGYGGDSYGRALVKADPAITTIVGGWTVHPYGGHGSSSAQANRPRVTEAYADTASIRKPCQRADVRDRTGNLRFARRSLPGARL